MPLMDVITGCIETQLYHRQLHKSNLLILQEAVQLITYVGDLLRHKEGGGNFYC